MSIKSPVINVMVQAARKAARHLVRDFGEVENLQVSKKGPADFVSAADLRAEKILLEELSRARPGYSFLLEEQGRVEGTDRTHCFIIDPLDGTTNFLHGLPHFAISIGLERDGEPVAGVVLDPIKDELFWAERGKGAFLNDRRLRVSSRSDLSQCLLATGIPFIGLDGHERFVKEMQALTPQIAGVRRFGSAALDLAYVAAGRYEGFWESGLKPWDVAAGIVLVKEAGGRVGQVNGSRYALGAPDILSTNDHMFDAVSKLLTQTRS